jgi:hypothetical protein
MGSNNPYYRLRALNTRWWAVVALVVLGSHVPASLQTVANLFIKTSSVYVMSESTALTYDSYSYYNVTAESIAASAALQGGIPTLGIATHLGGVGIPNATDLASAFEVLVQGVAFSNTDSSTRTVDGQVVTTVVRSNYIVGSTFKTVDISNSIRRPETVAHISSTCSTHNVTFVDLQGVLTSTSVHFNLSDASTGAGQFLVVVLDGNGTVLPDSTLSYRTSALFGECIGCIGSTGVVVGYSVNCTSTVDFQEEDIIYRLSTGGVTAVGLVNGSTTVQPVVAARFISGFLDAVNNAAIAVGNPQASRALVQGLVDTEFPQGYFTEGQFNYQHSIVCSAVSQTLGRLWTIAQGPNSTASLSSVPLYSVSLQTYVSSRNMALFASMVIAATLVICALGSWYTHQSPINIKDSTENALIENLTSSAVHRKMGQCTSNDPAMQLHLAFNHIDGLPVTLYCREHKYVDSNGVDMRKVSVGYEEGGRLPDRRIDYA